MLIWMIFIASLVAATIIANSAQQLFMKVMGANVMFFSGKKKLIAIIVIALILSAIIIQLFGIKIPNNSTSSHKINNKVASSQNTSETNTIAVLEDKTKGRPNQAGIDIHEIGVRPQYQGISVSTNNSMIVMPNGDLFIWGSAKTGRLGNDTISVGVSHHPPVKIMENIIAVSSGDVHNVAISSDGRLWGWGMACAIGQSMRMSDVITTPVEIMDQVVSVSSGSAFTMAIRQDGTLWAIGPNICTGNTRNEATPIKVMDNVTSVSAGGDHVMVITNDGVLWAWGSNEVGQLGDGSLENRASPVRVMNNVVHVSTGGWHTAAITADGGLWTWGENSLGQLGDGKYGVDSHRTTPMKIMDNVVWVSAGGRHTVAITADDSLWDWGSYDVLQILIEAEDIKTTPSRIMDNISYAVTGGGHTLAVANDGVLWALGQNGLQGLLGDDSKKSYKSPIKTLFSATLPDIFLQSNNPSSQSNEPPFPQTDSNTDNSYASTRSFDGICESLIAYYKGYLQAINQQDIDYINYATTEQIDYLSEKIFGVNKDYIFTFDQAIVDLDTVNFIDNGALQLVEFIVAFQFSDEPRSGGTRESGANVQRVQMVLLEDANEWWVSSTENQNDVTIGSNQRILK